MDHGHPAVLGNASLWPPLDPGLGIREKPGIRDLNLVRPLNLLFQLLKLFLHLAQGALQSFNPVEDARSSSQRRRCSVRVEDRQ